MPVAVSSYLAGFICFGMFIVSGPGLKAHRRTGSTALLAKSRPAGEPMNEEAAQLSAVVAVPAANAAVKPGDPGSGSPGTDATRDRQ